MDICTLKHMTMRTETGLLSYLKKGLPSPGCLPTASQNLGELEERGLGEGVVLPPSMWGQLENHRRRPFQDPC